MVGSPPRGGRYLCPACTAMQLVLGSAVTSGQAVCGQNAGRGLRHCLDCFWLLVLAVCATVLGSASSSSGSKFKASQIQVAGGKR